MSICKILGVPFQNITPGDAEERIVKFLHQRGKAMVFTLNPELVLAAHKDEEFMKILNESAMNIPDGIGIIYGSKFTNNPIKSRVAGYDCVQGVFELIKDTNKTVYFFGGAPEIAERAKEAMEKKHYGLKIVGVADGYFDAEKEQMIIADINEKKPDLLLVGIGFPKQEKWIYENLRFTGAKAAIGVGGSFDVMAGNTKRAPKVFQKLGLEWFYRLLCQPTRIGRMMKLPKFAIKVLLSKKG